MEISMANMELPKQYFISAFLSMEPPNHLISLAKNCGGGSITEEVQEFIWANCVNRSEGYYHEPYLKNFTKKLIKEIESSGGNVLDEFYERYACYMVSVKEDGVGKGDSWVVKYISFLFLDGPSWVSMPLRCSLNMLQGDTGCALWPSSLFLSEFILSFPQVFTRKSCFEVGSGVGLVGICLQRAKASQVILTDGDASTLANLKVNLEMNKIGNIDGEAVTTSDAVRCVHLPWESARECELQQFMPDIVLGADVIYDPSCLPDLVRVLTILLRREKPVTSEPYSNPQGPDLGKYAGLSRISSDRNGSPENIDYENESAKSDEAIAQAAALESLSQEMKSRPVAIIASVIRNIDTFNCFLDTSRRANLLIRDLTESIRFSNLIPYMESYKRSDVRLFMVSYVSK